MRCGFETRRIRCFPICASPALIHIFKRCSAVSCRVSLSLFCETLMRMHSIQPTMAPGIRMTFAGPQ
jgi:hypothetical protein